MGGLCAVFDSGLTDMVSRECCKGVDDCRLLVPQISKEGQCLEIYSCKHNPIVTVNMSEQIRRE